MIKTFFQWVVYSSKDPSKISLTIKGITATIISVLAILGVHSIPADQINGVTDMLLETVTQGIAFISSIVALYGAVRKIWLTAFGDNRTI